MTKNLRVISKNVKDMIGETQSLSGSTHQSGTSFLSQVEEGIKTVIHSLSENIKRGKEISASVSSAVNGMEKFVKEIEEIGADIELIAFNAQVKAKRAGEEGKTLGTIAEEIQKLAVEAGNYTAVISEKLKAIAFDTEIFHADTDSILGNHKTGDTGIANIFEDLLSSIRRINAEFIALLGRVTESGQTLGEEIETLANQIIFHKETARTIDCISDEFDGIAAHARKLVPSSSAHNKAARLEIQAPHYTKQSDLIHHTIQIDQVVHPPVALASSKLTGKNITISDAKDAGEVDFGGNVELF
ncbi:MAG: methyl-accepting chemotaxis protein [Candidatus Brocadiaceae bacterium]|nr:methyl-accepting chemotaxis protein [Candidatus Brocadiaceae bacterium]